MLCNHQHGHLTGIVCGLHTVGQNMEEKDRKNGFGRGVRVGLAFECPSASYMNMSARHLTRQSVSDRARAAGPKFSMTTTIVHLAQSTLHSVVMASMTRSMCHGRRASERI